MRKRSKLKIYEYQESFKKYYDEGWGVREIARFMGRNASTISRLINRDIHPCPGIWRKMTSFEKAMYAWEKSKKRASKSRTRLRLKTARIRKVVVYILRRWHWSPEKISGFLKLYEVFISAKAIYNFIKKERKWLAEHLRRKGKPRKQRVARARSHFKEGVPAKKSIHSRPPIVEPGHWEIDTIHSKKGTNGGILTLREMKSKQCFYFLIPDLTAKSVMKILFSFFQALPDYMCKTLTSDNGGEFAELYKLEKTLENFAVYYCDPYKAYQRGSVENGNGELRRYFPKKTDFSKVSEQEIRKAQYKINWTPMELHNGRAADAVYKQIMKAAA